MSMTVFDDFIRAAHAEHVRYDTEWTDYEKEFDIDLGDVEQQVLETLIDFPRLSRVADFGLPLRVREWLWQAVTETTDDLYVIFGTVRPTSRFS